jgi:hypothetical protein
MNRFDSEAASSTRAAAKVNILAKVSHLPFKPTGIFSSFSGGEDKVGAFWDTVKGKEKEEETEESEEKETEVA